MTASRLCRALLTAGLVIALPARAHGNLYAIVIGNNQSDSEETQELRFADDDAVAMHRLLSESGATSRLFVNLDQDSQLMHEEVAITGSPTWTAIQASFAELRALIRADRERGVDSQFLFFYSGHGNVEGGEGYVVLDGSRLTRTLLHSQLIDRSGATENHVLVDACRSYFLAFDKGPGGARAPYRGPGLAVSKSTPGRTGYILSTSSDRESHEWDRFQAGVFSHELRSGLRGAADVNRDGAITYAEIGAFLTTANSGIKNPRFRPDFVVKPARGYAAEVLRWPTRARSVLLLDRPERGRLYVEGPLGDRILDVHAAAGQQLLVHLPKQRPIFIRQEGSEEELAVRSSSPARVSALTAARARVASKGALHLAFRELFAVPFSGRDVLAYRRSHASNEVDASQPGAPGISMAASRPARSLRTTVLGGVALTSLATGAIALGWALERRAAASDADQVRRQEINGKIDVLTGVAAVSFALAAGTGVAWWFAHDEDSRRSVSVSVTPTASSNGAGAAAVLVGSF